MKRGSSTATSNPPTSLLDAKGRATIMDFGLARLTEASRLTKADTTMGTVAYMSPEQAQGMDVDYRSDIWALGCVLYEMVCGQKPFKGVYDKALLYEIVHQQPEPLTGLRTGVPIELELLTSKCLAKDAADRYQHASDAAVDLRTLGEKLKSGRSTILRTANVTAGVPATMMAGQTGSPIEALPPDAMVVRRSRQRALQAVAAVATLAMLGLALLHFTEVPTGSSPTFAANLTMELAPAEMLGLAVFYNRASRTAFAISPDGATVVFSGTATAGDDRTLMLYRRPLAEPQAVAIPGTTGAEYPFFSPDGQWVGFGSGTS